MTYDVFVLIWCLTNLVAFCTYGLDKFAASRDMRRVPEDRLLMLTLAGGLGAMAASSLFRHKTRKQPFRRYAVFLAAAHLVLSVLLLVYIG